MFIWTHIFEQTPSNTMQHVHTVAQSGLPSQCLQFLPSIEVAIFACQVDSQSRNIKVAHRHKRSHVPRLSRSGTRSCTRIRGDPSLVPMLIEDLGTRLERAGYFFSREPRLGSA